MKSIIAQESLNDNLGFENLPNIHNAFAIFDIILSYQETPLKYACFLLDARVM